MFNDTIRFNLSYSRPDATDEEVTEAARRATILPFIERQPKKWDTCVGERGLKLSGGEKQRIAIARAIIKDAPILILDEATSALDTQSESNVQNAIERLREGRTTVVVAHRLSTVLNADRIIVLDQGKIVQSGTHQDLIGVTGLYGVLYNKMQESA